MIAWLLAAESGGRENFVVLDVRAWHWIVLLAIITAMLLVDLLVVHREAHEVKTKEAAIESAICAVDPYCCDVAWDEICVDEVSTICGGTCPGLLLDSLQTTARLQSKADVCGEGSKR